MQGFGGLCLSLEGKSYPRGHCHRRPLWPTIGSILRVTEDGVRMIEINGEVVKGSPIENHIAANRTPSDVHDWTK